MTPEIATLSQWGPRRIFCKTTSGMVHLVTVTYPDMADTACGEKQVSCNLFWTEGNPDVGPVLRDATRCETCFPARGGVPWSSLEGLK